MTEKENGTEYHPTKNFNFVAHDYKIESDKKDDDGIPIVDRIVLLTKSPNVDRGRVTHNPEITKTEIHDGKKINVPGSPTVLELEDPINTIIEKLENGELVSISATVTEIVPEDGSQVYHSIVKNHVGTIEAELMRGDEAEKFRDKFIRDDSEGSGDDRIV